MVHGEEEVGAVGGDRLDGAPQYVAARLVLFPADPDHRVPERLERPRDLLGQEVAEVEQGDREPVGPELGVPQPLPEPERHRAPERIADRPVVSRERRRFGHEGKHGQRGQPRLEMEARDLRHRLRGRPSHDETDAFRRVRALSVLPAKIEDLRKTLDDHDTGARVPPAQFLDVVPQPQPEDDDHSLAVEGERVDHPGGLAGGVVETVEDPVGAVGTGDAEREAPFPGPDQFHGASRCRRPLQAACPSFPVPRSAVPASPLPGKTPPPPRRPRTRGPFGRIP